MAVESQVQITHNFFALGRVGEAFTSEPIRSRGYFINSYNEKGHSNEAYNTLGNVIFQNKKYSNVVGHFVKEDKKTIGDDQGNPAGILAFHQALVRPNLEAWTTSVPNNQQVEVMQQGYVVVVLHALADTEYKDSSKKFSGNIGDLVYYDPIYGSLTSVAYGTEFKKDSTWRRLQGANVAIYNTPALSANHSSLAVIYLDMAGDRSEFIATN